MPISTLVASVLRCPDCHGHLVDESAPDGPHMRCEACATIYPVSGDRIDLRPRRRLEWTMSLGVEPPEQAHEHALPTPLPPGPYPAMDVPSDDWALRYGNRLTPILSSHVPLPSAPSDVLLDVGCGNTILGGFVASGRGFQYLGVDYADDAAPVLADVEHLPVASDSIPVAVSFAVLEHVRSPVRMAAEIGRSLRPGGAFVGTVAFLEPFHFDSYFHHTHIGLRSVLHDAGFDVVGVESNEDWLVWQSVMEMGDTTPPLVQRIARKLRHLAHTSPRLRDRLRPNALRLASITAGFRFVALKPGASK
jgi:SAM-dependent methyltransferase